MRRAELEVKVLEIVERVQRKQQSEDSLVELKAEWPKPEKAARQLAGHCNAARGENVLWIIGIDEQRGVVGTDQEDLASWYDSVRSRFDAAVAPAIELSAAIPASGKAVMALLFDTQAAPFVVSSRQGGEVQKEVPWREATGTRSATRSDLLRIIVPACRLPLVELFHAELAMRQEEAQGDHKGILTRWTLQVDFYVTFTAQSSLVIPYHKCDASFAVGEYIPSSEDRLESFSISVVHSNCHSIVDGGTEFIIDGCGQACLRAAFKPNDRLIKIAPSEKASFVVQLGIAGEDRRISIEGELDPPASQAAVGGWVKWSRHYR